MDCPLLWYAVRAAVTLIRIGWLVHLWTILLTAVIVLRRAGVS
jgi:hypothetical protein